MKVLVIAGSAYGNTWSLACAIADTMGNGATALRPNQVAAADMEGLDLMIVGSPTQGGRPIAPIKEFLRSLPAAALSPTRVAAFDTRVAVGDQGFAMRRLLGIIGYAAPKIARDLTAHGGHLVAPPEGFIVEGKEGPLRAGELERAAEWAHRLQSLPVH